MYTIKQAAARSGVAVATLRAWERRYAVVRPARTPSGYRLYDDEAIARLAAMRRLVESGWQPSVAAGEILRDVADAGRPEAGPARSRAEGVADEPAQAAELLPGRLVTAAAAMDDAALERVLDDLFARASFERGMRDELFPALRALGDAWASGQVSVAGEHLASNAVLRRLGLALDAAGHAEAGAAPVVVALPPGSRHELGALAFAVALRRGGLPVAYLGADLPLDDWARAAAGAAAVIIGVATRRDRRAAREVVARLREDVPELLVAVGGPAAEGVDPQVVLLPAELDVAADLLRALLRHRAGA